MKLYLQGHDYKYAAEQMLLVPHGMGHPAGAPVLFACAGELNPPGSKVFGENLGTRRLARKRQQQKGWRYS